MAKFEDYLPGGANDPTGGNIDGEIADATKQQQARHDDSTPDVDWEQRYKELEKFNSRQAQTVGEYRKIIDDYIINPTPANEADTQTNEPATFSLDDFYEDPNQALNKVLDSHPAIQEARKVAKHAEEDARQRDLNSFTQRHPDYADVGSSPEFQNWVVENPTRLDLFQRGNQYDFSAADALFSLYKAEKGMAQVNNQQAIDQAELVSSSGELAPAEPPKYSRHEYIATLTRAKQGDLEAEAWIKANAQGYRLALQSGNVRD